MRRRTGETSLLLPPGITACLFDLDGVITRTAELHAAAWKRTFDDFLRERASSEGEPVVPFDIRADYVAHVDGKYRADGVRSFLASRGISVPEGAPSDPPSAATVHGLGTRKNRLLAELSSERGVAVYEGSRRFLSAARAAGIARALVTSSENAGMVLRAAGLEGEFDAQVDGTIARRLELAGKPAPDLFLEAARRLGTAPPRAAVLEDALAGVAAGRAGGFGFVVGVDRTGQAAALRASGADTVVSDLVDLIAA